jgi:hypothetical protein
MKPSGNFKEGLINLREESRLKPPLASTIKAFVRAELGCTCPDEVFATIDVQSVPRPFDGVHADWLITIGDRLLLVLIETTHWHDVSRNLEQLVSRGRQQRDACGFNRVRFVIATAECESAESLLRERFAALSCVDDRTHLHIVSPQQVPMLSSTGQGGPGP